MKSLIFTEKAARNVIFESEKKSLKVSFYLKKKLQAACPDSILISLWAPMIKEPIKFLIGQLYSMNNKDISIYKRVFLATASFPKNNKFTCLIWHMPFLM